MTLSLIIPTYTLSKALEDMALRAVMSYSDFVDELIVVEDHGMYSPLLMQVADLYVYSNLNVGFTKNVNRGWRYATGDYVAIVNSDTYLISGNLKDLCVPGKVTSPVIKNQTFASLGIRGCFWCVPKEITQKLGYLNEAMHTYYSDEDYMQRTKDLFVEVPSVEIYHDMAQTVTPAGVNNPEEQERDRKMYQRLTESEAL